MTSSAVASERCDPAAHRGPAATPRAHQVQDPQSAPPGTAPLPARQPSPPSPAFPGAIHV